ncbi:DUF5999 family protein [Streptomyces sp. NPDC002076]
MHKHWPAYPGVESPNRDAVQAVVLHPQQSWYLLCNKVVLFNDCGELLPDGTTVRLDGSVAETTSVATGRAAPGNVQCWEAS